ncbi:hypothetical protein BDV38DRAFT_252289, partial [Aspergillus pseudotamarii]
MSNFAPRRLCIRIFFFSFLLFLLLSLLLFVLVRCGFVQMLYFGSEGDAYPWVSRTWDG